MRHLRHKWLETPVNTRVSYSDVGDGGNDGNGGDGGDGGFTLIEILVVVVIIGIALSLAVAKLYPDENERLRQETDRTLALLETARDEAAFSGHTIAFNIAENTLTFYARDTKSADIKWLPVRNPPLSARPFADGISVALQIGGRGQGPGSGQGGDPTNRDALALFQPAGVGVPFEVQLVSNYGQRVIASDALGNLALVNEAAGKTDAR